VLKMPLLISQSGKAGPRSDVPPDTEAASGRMLCEGCSRTKYARIDD
jgi:hypothetical protein